MGRVFVALLASAWAAEPPESVAPAPPACERGTPGCYLALAGELAHPIASALVAAWSASALANNTTWVATKVPPSFSRSTLLATDHVVGGDVARAALATGVGIASFQRGGISGAGLDTGAEGASLPPDILACPLFVTAVAPVYNLPNTRTRVELSLPAIADLLLGKTVTWAELTEGQLPASSEPGSSNVTLVLRSDTCGVTALLTAALARASAEFRATVGDKGRLGFADFARLVARGRVVEAVASEAAMRASVAQTVGSLGFAALDKPLGHDGLLPDGRLRVALLRLAPGAPLLAPTPEALDACGPQPPALQPSARHRAAASAFPPQISRASVIEWPAGSAGAERGAYVADAAAAGRAAGSGCWPLARSYAVVVRAAALEPPAAQASQAAAAAAAAASPAPAAPAGAAAGAAGTLPAGCPTLPSSVAAADVPTQPPAANFARWLLGTAEAAHVMIAAGAAPSAAGSGCAAAVLLPRRCVDNGTAEAWAALVSGNASRAASLGLVHAPRATIGRGSGATNSRAAHSGSAGPRAPGGGRSGTASRVQTSIRYGFTGMVLLCAVFAIGLFNCTGAHANLWRGRRRGRRVAHGTHEFDGVAEAGAEEDEEEREGVEMGRGACGGPGGGMVTGVVEGAATWKN